MSTIATLITAAAKSVGVPASLLLAICTHETGLNNIVVPHDGGSPSIGVCQVKESTARLLGFRGKAMGKLRQSKVFPWTMEPVGKPVGLLDPATNALYAAKYLKRQLERYDGEWCKATAAYNAGKYNPSAVAPGRPRNLKYVKKVTLLLDEGHQDLLVCGSSRDASAVMASE